MNVWHQVEFGWDNTGFYMVVDGNWFGPEPFDGKGLSKCYPEIFYLYKIMLYVQIRKCSFVNGLKSTRL